MKRDYRQMAEAMLLNCEEDDDIKTLIEDILREAHKLRDAMPFDFEDEVGDFDEAMEDMQ